jgi:hypothetical protein
MTTQGTDEPQRDPWFGQRLEVIAGPFMWERDELIRVKSQDCQVINAYLMCSSVSLEVDSAEMAIP